MDTVKILWVHDEFNGPMNGLAEYNNDKVWFERLNDDKESEERNYKLKKVDALYITDVLENNHKLFCEQTGAPLNHGDPIKINRKHISSNKNTMITTKTFTHAYDPMNIPGEILIVIKESQFSNYFVPRRVEME